MKKLSQELLGTSSPHPCCPFIVMTADDGVEEDVSDGHNCDGDAQQAMGNGSRRSLKPK